MQYLIQLSLFEMETSFTLIIINGGIAEMSPNIFWWYGTVCMDLLWEQNFLL